MALRKLCLDLIKDFTKTDRIPIYINLREWFINEKWSDTNPPTEKQLKVFVLKNLRERLNEKSGSFLSQNFAQMLVDNRFFIVFDSFDEIPSVLDEPDMQGNKPSWLIDQLSGVIFKFLHGSGGILASRQYRKPTSKFAAKISLKIRPFTETKIIETLQKAGCYNDEIVKQLFRDRYDLVPAIRNPMMTGLLAHYLTRHNTLPPNLADMFSSFIELTIKDHTEEKPETVIECLTDIAAVLFYAEKHGLEMPYQILKDRFMQTKYALNENSETLHDLFLKYPIDTIIEDLHKAKFIRLGSGELKRFSFAHRRFNEYFVALNMMKNSDETHQKVGEIPKDTRWRDALVLYCQITEIDDAKRIADFCWEEVRQIKDIELDNPQYLRSVHSLRFLEEAFHSRLNCIEAFQDELGELIHYQIEFGDDLLTVKLAIEGVGLLKEKKADAAVISALEIEDEWVSNTAIRACRHLPQISHKLEEKLETYISGMGRFKLLKRQRELKFSFGLSDAFKKLKLLVNCCFADLALFSIGFVLLMFMLTISPQILGVSVSLTIISVALFVAAIYMPSRVGLEMLDMIGLGKEAITRLESFNPANISLLVAILLGCMAPLWFSQWTVVREFILYIFDYYNISITYLFNNLIKHPYQVLLICIGITFVSVPWVSHFFYPTTKISKREIREQIFIDIKTLLVRSFLFLFLFFILSLFLLSSYYLFDLFDLFGESNKNTFANMFIQAFFLIVPFVLIFLATIKLGYYIKKKEKLESIKSVWMEKNVSEYNKHLFYLYRFLWGFLFIVGGIVVLFLLPIAGDYYDLYFRTTWVETGFEWGGIAIGSVVGIGLTVFAILLILSFFGVAYDFFKQRIALRQIIQKLYGRASLDRTEIDLQIKQLHKGWWGILDRYSIIGYLRFLESKNILVTGKWPDDGIVKRYYLRYDKVATILAQLEEKWRGLDR